MPIAAIHQFCRSKNRIRYPPRTPAKGDPAPRGNVERAALAPVLGHVARLRRNGPDRVTRLTRSGPHHQAAVIAGYGGRHHVKCVGPRPQIARPRPAVQAPALALHLAPSLRRVGVAGAGDADTGRVGGDRPAERLQAGAFPDHQAGIGVIHADIDDHIAPLPTAAGEGLERFAGPRRPRRPRCRAALPASAASAGWLRLQQARKK